MFRRFRRLGMDQTGSMLAAGIVILGVFAVLFTAGVRQEGSAQAMDILTAHRRKALDIARGGIDKLLMEFNKSFNVADCKVGDLTPPDVLSTLRTKAKKDAATGEVTLTSIATVSGVPETVSVTLAPLTGGLFESLFGQRTLATNGTVYLRNNSKGTVEGPVYYPPGHIVRDKNSKVNIPLSTGTVEIPDVNTVKTAIQSQFNATATGYNKLPSNNISGKVVYVGNYVTSKSVTLSGSGFDFQLDGNLVVNGSVSTSNNSKGKITVNGDLIINGGDLTFSNNSDCDLILNGNIVVLGGKVETSNNSKLDILGQGMVLTVPKSGLGFDFVNNSVVNIGDPSKVTKGLSLITTGGATFYNNGTVRGSLLLYASSIIFENNCWIDANISSVISPGDITFSNNSDVTLRRGSVEDWEEHPDLEGGTGGYQIVSWGEGNRLGGT